MEILHPYDQFLAEQSKREVDWKRQRDAKKAAKVPSTPAVAPTAPVTSGIQDQVFVLQQRLATKEDECRDLKKQLERIEASNVKILSNQKQMQQDFVKVKCLYNYARHFSLKFECIVSQT